MTVSDFLGNDDLAFARKFRGQHRRAPLGKILVRLSYRKIPGLSSCFLGWSARGLMTISNRGGSYARRASLFRSASKANRGLLVQYNVGNSLPKVSQITLSERAR